MRIFPNGYPANRRLIERRAFLAGALRASGASALLAIPGAGKTIRLGQEEQGWTVQNIIDLILKEIPGAPFKQTVDTIKCGSPSQPVRGIVTTMFPTIQVIQEAAGIKANFIIAHEPSFYNHTDDQNWVARNHILEKKLALLQQENIAIWRFHDYWHSYRPDGIGYGVLKATGLLKNYQPGRLTLQLPALTLRELIGHLQKSLTIQHLRYIGDPEQICKSISILPGAAGGQRQIALVENDDPDVLIVGEVHEWETAEYIRDARQLGSRIALIVLGHSLSEEPGMQWLVDWLQPKLPNLPITHISSGDPFSWT
jgi:putative NIF3 family GTP cyclohydrolase 1 type 2